MLSTDNHNVVQAGAPCTRLKETYQNISALFDHVGITRVANVTGLDHIGIPVVMAVRPNAKSLAVSQGKGETLLNAKISACMEGIELFHAENINIPTISSRYSDLLNSGTQVANIRNLARSRTHPFDPQAERPWVEARCVRTNQAVAVPLEVINLDTTNSMSEDCGTFIADSNGLAAGRTHDDAVLHGLYECIERDAIALWSCAPNSCKAATYVDINTIDNPVCVAFIEQIRRAGAEIHIWDATSDIGIPTFSCLICCPHRQVRPGFGSGTHLNKGVALSKAITEAAQSRLTFISGARDDQPKSLYLKQMQASEIDTHTAMRPSDHPGLDFQRTHSATRSVNSTQDLAILYDALASCDVRTILTIDLTKPDIGIPVVRVLVPGLENLSKTHVRIPGERLMSRVRAYAQATH